MFHTDAQIQYGDGRRRKLLPFIFIMLILIVIGTASQASCDHIFQEAYAD